MVAAADAMVAYRTYPHVDIAETGARAAALLHEIVERAIKSSMDRASESEQKKVVEQAAERTAAIVEQARKASKANAEQIDAKVRDAVRGAVIDKVHRTVESRMPRGMEAFYNGSLEISEAYNRVTLQGIRQLTPPILLVTIPPLIRTRSSRSVPELRTTPPG